MSGADAGGRRPEDLPDNLDQSGDGVITTEELVEHFDLDEDGQVTVDEFSEEHKQDRLDKELERLKTRRSDSGRRFIRGFEDIVLMGGVTYGVLFLITITVLSSGQLMADEVGVDQYLSTTIVDPGPECIDNSNNTWMDVWIDENVNLRVRAYNIPPETDVGLRYQFGVSEGNESGRDIAIPLASEMDPVADGEYNFVVRLYNTTDENITIHNVSNSEQLIDPVSVNVVVESEVTGLDKWFNKEAEPEKIAHIAEDTDRSCWSMQQLGVWAWALMTAEWAGGRETAMLSGGSAGVPAWWMAYVSLSMSVFFLFVQYPLMYRFYHRDTDDMLTEDQVARLVRRALENSEKKLNIVIDWDEFRMRKRDLSIDVLVPYKPTITTVTKGDGESQIRDEMLNDVLKEFEIYGEITPLQLKVKAQGEKIGGLESLLDHDRITDDDAYSQLPELNKDRPAFVEDYSSFFEDLNTLANAETEVKKALKDFCVIHRLEDKEIWVGVDEQHVMVRFIYKPMTRFAFFRFKESHVGVRSRVREHLKLTAGKHIGDRELIVSASNLVHTLADRSAAGRIEEGKGGIEGQAFVAKQEGIAGTLLQSRFAADILSSVEYVAHKNRDRIDRWGFWGLILFVWIPFMASGVLVGAMLGLVARMSFPRVLLACFVGGAAASITWAYTAEGIINIMHALNADLFIPIMIFVIFMLAVVHIRTNKRRRQEVLFHESVKFFKGDYDEQEQA